MLAIARAGDGGADAVDDLVRLILGDLDELVLQVATLGGDERWAELPDEIPGKCLVALTANVSVSAPKHAPRPLATTQAIHDSIVSDLIWHPFPSLNSLEYLGRRTELVSRRQPSAGKP